MNNNIDKLKHTDIYDTFWYFTVERQNIFTKKFNKEKKPWSSDKIFQQYKFTNTYRVLDRVSQYLISNVIAHEKDFTLEDNLFRILFFKMFNKIETWEYLSKKFIDISYSTYTFDKYDKELTKMMEKKIKIYSAAYIMPSGVTSFGFKKKHQNNLKLLEKIMQDKPIHKINKMKSMEELYEYLKSFPMIGSFLAYQFAIDINYSQICNFSENDFVVAGPGAIRGIKKCFLNTTSSNYEDIIKMVQMNQDEEFKKRNLVFQKIGHRELQLIDIQNLFCEIDKYTREANASNGDKKRIKQKYRENINEIKYTFPNKWQLDIYKRDA